MKKAIGLLVLGLVLVACGTVNTIPEAEADEIAMARVAIGIDPCFIRGCSWNALGGRLSPNADSRSFRSDLALDPSGNPVVSYVEATGSNFLGSLYVKRWNGSGWLNIGGAVFYGINITWPSPAPILAVDRNGYPVVAYQDHRAASRPSDPIFVKRWNGSSWVDLGRVPCSDVSTGFGDMALDANGKVIFACSNQFYNGSVEHNYTSIYRWEDNQWRRFTGLQGSKRSRIVVDAQNNVLLTYVEAGTGALKNLLFSLPINQYIGGDTGGIFNPSAFDVQLDSRGKPVLAAVIGSGANSQLIVKQIANNSNSYTTLGVPFVGVSNNTISLSIGANNQMALAFVDASGLTRVNKFNPTTNAWQPVGNAVNPVANPLGRFNPTVVLKANGTPVVSLSEYVLSQPRSVYVKEWGTTPAVIQP